MNDDLMPDSPPATTTAIVTTVSTAAKTPTDSHRVECKDCKRRLSTHEFTPSSLKLRICRVCTKTRARSYLGDNPAVMRAYKNLRNRLRTNDVVEGVVWTPDDVRRLVEAAPVPQVIQSALESGFGQRAVKYRIVKVDEGLPFTPDNAMAEIFGCRKVKE